MPTARPRRHDRRRFAAASLTACLSLLTLASCGRRDLHPVSGTVRFPDGSPLTTGRVVVDYGLDSNPGGWGYIQPDGTFTLGSLTQTDGVRAGKVRVAITFAYAATDEEQADAGATALKPLVHPRFESPETSGLSFEIPRQKTWAIVVERP